MNKYYKDEDIVKMLVDITSQPANWARQELSCIPTADVAPVIHAHWIRKAFFPDGTPAWVCSACGHPEEEKLDYCNCGAKMDDGIDK